jgi:hypothetical protein
MIFFDFSRSVEKNINEGLRKDLDVYYTTPKDTSKKMLRNLKHPK